MANFIAVLDPVLDRREGYIERVQSLLAPVPGLECRRSQLEHLTVVSAAHRDAPLEEWLDDRSAATIWGQAFHPSGAAMTAHELVQDGASWDSPDGLGGFHATVAYRAGIGLRAGADLLGLFPLYYASADGVVIVSSTPEAFRHHPLFRAELNFSGLAALLLLHSPSQGETLHAAVRRLQPGHVLMADAGREVREVAAYTLPSRPILTEESFRHHVDLLQAALEASIARQASSGIRHGLLLSGGRDSRMLAGFLADLGHRPLAITLGETGDHELQCAIPVAEALGLEHRVATLDPATYVWAAETQAKWEHLSTGFANIPEWCSIEVCGPCPRFVSGVMADAVLSMPRRAGPSASFEAVFPPINRSGFAPELLDRLLKAEPAREAVQALQARLRLDYYDPRIPESRRWWRFQLDNGERFRVGGMLWRKSFGAWPVVPVLDRRILDLGCGLPLNSLAGRRLQDAIIRRRFPALARIPVVAMNADITLPIRATVFQRLGKYLRDKVGTRRSVPAGRELRFNYRMADFNGPGWRAVRRAAEPHRDALAPWFDMDVLRAVLPPPEAEVSLVNGIVDSRRLKLLVGLIFWARNHAG